MSSVEVSLRIRPALRRITFTNHIGQSLTVMKTCYERGLNLPAEPSQPGERGAGKPLPQEW